MNDGVLDDGTYDVIIVDATTNDDGSRTVELTLLAGPRKGEIVTLRTTGLPGDGLDLPGDDLDLLGMPGTLEVADGLPGFRVDD